MDRVSKISQDGASAEKEEHIAVKKLQVDIEQSIKNIASCIKKRNQEDKLLKLKQEEKAKIQEEVVNMKGQLRYDSIQMPSIETNLRQIGEKKNLIEDYTAKIKSTLPNLSDASLAIKNKLYQQRNYVHDFLSNLEAKNRDTEKERALVEERKREVKQKFQETVEYLNSSGFNIATNLKRLKHNKCTLQEALKESVVENKVVMQKIESVRERKALLKKQYDDKQQRHCELLQEVDQQKVMFEHIQREEAENLANLSAKIQKLESKRTMLELEKVKKEGSAVNMLKELEIKETENSNLKLKNDELAVELNQVESKMEEDNKKMDVEFSSKQKESERSRNNNKELEAILDDYEKKLVLEKQAKKEIDLKIEDQKRKLEKLKVECEQQQKFVQEVAEKLERLTNELSITQEEIISLNEEFSKEKENKNMQEENEIREIELEIETINAQNSKAIAEFISGNNQLVTEFEEQTQNEMKYFEQQSREMENTIGDLREKLVDESMTVKDLEEGIAQKNKEIEEMKRVKSLLELPSSPKPLIKLKASSQQVPKASASKFTGLKKLPPHSQALPDRSTGMNEAASHLQTPHVHSTRSVGLKEDRDNSFSITSSCNKRRKFEEMSDSSIEDASYNFKTFAALRQEQINKKNLRNKK